MTEIEVLQASFSSSLKSPGALILYIIVSIAISGSVLATMLAGGYASSLRLGLVPLLGHIELILVGALVGAFVLGLFIYPFFIGIFFNSAAEGEKGDSSLGRAYQATKKRYVDLFLTYLIPLLVQIAIVGVPLLLYFSYLSSAMAALNSTAGSGSAAAVNAAFSRIGTVLEWDAVLLVAIIISLVVDLFIYPLPASVVIEGRKGIDALKRSVEIARANLISIFIIGVLLAVAAFVASIVIGIISAVFIFVNIIVGYVISMVLGTLLGAFIIAWTIQSIHFFYKEYVKSKPTATAHNP
jgi:hypothetical protein